ncbi:MAG: ribosome maturation factor RimP [Humibacillus sp.]
MSTVPDLRETLEPVLAALGLVVEDVTVSTAGRRRLVRVLVDSDTSSLAVDDTTSRIEPLSLDAVAEATRAVSDALEPDDVMGSAPYVLEVSSPGVGRRLTTRDQLRRQVGRLVEVSHAGTTVTGRLVEVTAEQVVVVVAATKKEPERRAAVALGELEHAIVQVEFRRADAPTVGADPDDDLDDGDHDDGDLSDDDADDDLSDDDANDDDDEAGPDGSATEGSP